jgi:5-methylcytosine-specific restriction endonuclease McrA
MNLKHLSDDAVLMEAERINTRLREDLISLLYHLREIDRRRLFAKLKFPSLFEYTIQKLKFSEDEANRRIAAMRLLQEVPEIEEKISSGNLSLSNVAMARRLFTKEKKAGRALDQKAKVEVLNQLENQPTRSAQKILCRINPEMNPRKQELSFHDIDDDELREKLLRVKGRFAHTHPHLTLFELLHKLCNEKLDEKVKSPPRRANSHVSQSVTETPGGSPVAKPVNGAANTSPVAQQVSAKPTSKAEVTRQIWLRDQSQCTNCGSHFAIEEDHRKPKATGGKYTLDNMRLLCRSCNQRAAIEYYGNRKMGQYLKSPVIEYRARPLASASRLLNEV